MPQLFSDRISAFLNQTLSGFSAQPIVYSAGTVTAVSDGVVHISGLSGCCYGELLSFDNGAVGMALELSETDLGAVLFDKTDRVFVGESVRRTGHVTEVPVGKGLIGRVVDPIGRPLDDENKPISFDTFYHAERSAPRIGDRKPVSIPLQTGIMAIDSMVPIGRGQRELIIGDRQTGKTSIALDAIANQKDSDVYCIYCAIGQKAAGVAETVRKLKESGQLAYTTVVAATASDSPAMQYLAPYSACAIGEYLMEKGHHVLVVYDDLSKHAVAYRAMSLLLRRPSGREAYPGDVFYLHSRLLERSAALSDEKGGGTLTALPIIETTGGNLSAYIPTNVISITDGQIYLETEAFHAGIRPAVNTGLSVSRVGRSAQTGAIKKVSGSLRISLSQYREMAVFARFGSDMDPSTKRLLANGERLTQLFVQKNGKVLSCSRQTLLLLCFENGIFDAVPVEKTRSAVQKLLLDTEKTCEQTLARIDRDGDFTDADRQLLLDTARQSLADPNAL